MDTSTVVPRRGLGALKDSAFAQWHAQSGHMLPWVPVCFGIGIGIYFALRFEPDTGQIRLITISAGLCAVLASLPRLYAFRAFWIAAALILSGIAHTALRAERVAAPVLEFRYYGSIEGRVVGVDRSASDKIRLTLDQLRLRNLSPAKTPERVRISLHSEVNASNLRHGDIIGTTGHLAPPSGPVEPGGFDFQRKAWFERLGAIGYTRIPVVRTTPTPEPDLTLRIGQIRMQLAAVIRKRIGGPQGPFAAAILTGDRSGIPREALEDLRATNLAHLLAISGLHMGLLTGAVFAAIRLLFALYPAVALRVPVKKIAAIVALIAGAFYLALSGSNVATQRAFIMVAVFFVAICLDRRALTLRSVAIAACGVLLVRPESLTSPGFQMSFAATTALVAAFSFWRDAGFAQMVPRWIKPALGVLISSFVAGLATAPYGAAYFNQFAHYGLIANILSVPVMGLLVMPGALIAGLLSLIGLEAVGIWMMQLGLGWILSVAQWIADTNGATSKIAQPGPLILPLITLGGLLFCLVKGPGRAVGATTLLIAIFMWPTPRPTVLLSNTGSLIGVMLPEGRALNKERGDGFAARVWLENDGDRADQAVAAMRAAYSRNLLKANLGAGALVYDRSKDLSQAEVDSYCTAHSVVLLPNWNATLPCLGANANDLRTKGALAIHLDEQDQPKLVFTNSLRGTRPWTGSQ